MFKVGDKIECVEEHSWTRTEGDKEVKILLVPKGFKGIVQAVQTCPSCGVQYVYLGFHHDSKNITCSVCKGSIPNEDNMIWSRCTRFKKLEENKATGFVEFKSIILEPKKIITPERIQEISAN